MIRLVHMPLKDKTVLVTRSRNQASDLSAAIRKQGGTAIEFPVISIGMPRDPIKLAALDSALHQLPDFDWVFFTSVNGVDFFIQRLRELRLDLQKIAQTKIAAVGPATAEALQAYGIHPEVVPNFYQAEGLFETVKEQLKPGHRVLLPTSDLARSYLIDELGKIGVFVTKVNVYENTLHVDENGDKIVELLEGRLIDAVTFTSSSTVRNLLQVLSHLGAERPLELLQGADICCIGPKTAETAEELGLQVALMAKEATIQSLVDGLVHFYRNTSVI